MKKQYISPLTEVFHASPLRIMATSGDEPGLSSEGYSDTSEEALVKSQNSLWDNDWDE